MGGCISLQLSLEAPRCYRVYKDNILNLEENLISLKAGVRELEVRRDDVVRRILIEEDKGLQRLASVQMWVLEVETLEREACTVLDVAQVETNRLCLRGRCSKSLRSSYMYGKRVRFLLEEVKRQSTTGIEVVVETPIYTPVFSPVLVGQEIMLERTRRLILMEDEIRVLGILGCGGVGKTALLTRVYNELSAQEVSPFDLFIWLVMPSDGRIRKIQDEIGKKLDLYNEEWERKTEAQKAMSIHSSLKSRRILVIFDDMMLHLDLLRIGIPSPTRYKECKIVITTRFASVCAKMGADISIHVHLLGEEDAWKLFQERVGQTTLGSHPEIPRLARILANTCHGLPLTLNLLGAAMSSKRTEQEWQNTINLLPRDLDFQNISAILNLSYDAIECKQVKLCFLFCALFPQDSEIRKEELVELWIGEGIIDENNGKDIGEHRGYEILGVLLAKCLLMEAGESRDKIKMHGIIEQMALNKASPSGEDQDQGDFIKEIYTQVGSTNRNWTNQGRVSLIGDDVKTISGDFDCPKLRTLLLRDTNLETITAKFFCCLPVLLVLDLSSNRHLDELPETVSKLVSLQYLNLSFTGIRQLPTGLSKLKKLIYLNLEHTHKLKDMAGISALVNIQVLRLCDSGFHASCSFLKELQLLEHLELLTITLEDKDVVKQFLSSPKLARCTQGIYLKYCALLSALDITSLSSSLRCLDVQDSYIPEMKIDHSGTGGEAMVTVNASPSDAFFMNLNEVRLDGCNGLRDLTLLLFAPNLATLRVVQSRDIEEIISKGKAVKMTSTVPFQRLEFLALEGLDKLRSIYWDPLPLPELREIRVRRCPSLTKFPVNSESAKGHNLVISAEKELMRRIEWEDEATKQRYGFFEEA